MIKRNKILVFTFLFLFLAVAQVSASMYTVNLRGSFTIESNGGLAVNIQDQTSPPVDFFFSKVNGVPTTVLNNVSIDDREINITNVSSCSQGDYFGLFNADDKNDNRASFSTIQSISGNTLTIDTPIDFDFRIGDTAACFNRNLNVDGSSVVQVFKVQVGPAANQCIDITRIMISFITDSAVSLAEFGDLPSLTNGLVLRRVDGDIRNFWNVKNNGELANLCFDYDPSESINPAQGQDGAKFRCTWAGQEKHGVAVRLCPGDSLDVLIQDNLEPITQFRIIAEGHYVTD